MKKKSKNKSRFKKLPKRWSGGLTYYDQNSQLFTPQEGNQFSSLAANTQYNNPNSLSANIRADNPNSFQNNGGIGEGINLNSTNTNTGSSFMDNAGAYGAVAQLAGSLTEGIGQEDYEAQYTQHDSLVADVASQIGPIGAIIGGASETVGNLAASGLDYNEYGVTENTGQLDVYNYVEAAIDPAGQVQKDIEEGEWGRAVRDVFLPMWGGMQSGREEQEEAKVREMEAKQAKNNARLSEINQNVQTYKPLYKRGGKLKKYPIGGSIDDPNKLEPLGPKMFEEEHDGYVHGKSGLQPYYKSRDIRVPGSQRPVMGYIDSPDNSRGSDKVYSGEFTPLGSTNTNKAAYGEPRLLTRTSAILRTAEILGEPVEKVKEVPDLYFKRLIDQSDGYFKRGVSGTNQETLQEIIPTKRYESEDFDKIKFKKFGGQLKNTFNRTPNIVNYKGQTHNGPDEGIPVDEEGNPSVVSGKEPIALTENGEVTWNGYVFSDKLY